MAVTKYYRDLAEWKTRGKAMYRSTSEMAQRRKFRALKMIIWLRAKRGGKDSREQKDVTTVFKNSPGQSGQGDFTSGAKKEEGKHENKEAKKEEKAGGKKEKTVMVETVTTHQTQH